MGMLWPNELELKWEYAVHHHGGHLMGVVREATDLDELDDLVDEEVSEFGCHQADAPSPYLMPLI